MSPHHRAPVERSELRFFFSLLLVPGFSCGKFEDSFPDGRNTDSYVPFETNEETASTQESGIELETDLVETDSQPETDSPWSSVLMECGEWETQYAPMGHLSVSGYASATFGDSGQHTRLSRYPVNAVADDIDGNGCSDILVASYQYDDEKNFYSNVYQVPGSLRGEFTSPGPYSAMIEAPYYHYLTEVSFGDIDGNGLRDDWIIGALGGGDENHGALYLFFAPLYGAFSEDDATATIWAPDYIAGMSGGLSVSDINSDGTDDVVIGWYLSGEDATLVSQVGIYSSPFSDDATFSETTALFSGLGSLAGENVSIAADLNGDGVHDLVYPTATVDERQDGVHIFYGPLSGTYTGGNSDSFISAEVKAWNSPKFPISAGADENGDGYDDLLVGESTESYGKAWLVLGGLFIVETLVEAEASFSGSDTWAFPYSLSLDQDVDSDGYSEVLIGFPGREWPTTDAEGAAVLYYGPHVGANSLDEADAVLFGGGPGWDYAPVGGFVRGLGDTDGDGYDDFVIGGIGSTPSYLFRGGPR